MTVHGWQFGIWRPQHTMSRTDADSRTEHPTFCGRCVEAVKVFKA
jgi:hypothetical protein